jgi:addiction module HigA family antidote
MAKKDTTSDPKPPTEPVHPGRFVRETVLVPKKLSVQAAAKLVGVGRPALSNFLNGRASTTPEMAARLETAFGVRASDLLDMQAAYDAAQIRETTTTARRYVAPFLQIKAGEIEQWVERNIAARTRLAVFLRTLVNSTGPELSTVDFPGNDDAERPGWDGYLEAPKGSRWIPAGISGWEFGTNKDVATKADGDFAKAIKANPKADRDKTTFVFVTPRHWPGKAAWLAKVRAQKMWQDVRAYDSSDLEQWLEQSLAAQAWFAGETDRPASDVRSLDKCWSDWAEVASPPLVGSLFAPAVESAARMVLARLQKAPDGPIIVAADSREEALAFLSQLFGPLGGTDLEAQRDRVLVFDAPGVLPRLAQGSTDFIAVTANRDVEREFGPLAKSLHTIVVYPRNAANIQPDIVLEPLSSSAFWASLEEMRLGRDEIARYSNESGRSLTVLRRRLAKVPAIRTPAWAGDRAAARSLIPYLFIGAWDRTNEADQAVLSLLSDGVGYDALEQRCQDFAALEDPPLWAEGRYRGVVSRIDLLFAIAAVMTTADLQRFFDVAKLVLAEDDPKLDLPDSDRWAAGLYGKRREISAAVREGISESFVLLAVYGNRLVERAAFNCERAAEQLVESLLTPLTTRTLEAHDRDLTAYAEAAPDKFLAILEDDLRSEQPETYGLLRPAGPGLFGSCPRSGLLWALEGLAWNPDTLARSALVLAQLAEIEINDNWSNKPINSLESIFRAWMPQTTADLSTRVRTVELIAERFPKTAWRICMSQLDADNRTGTYSHKPVWRTDGYGYGEPVATTGPVFEFKRKLLDMALAWREGYTADMVCDLIEQLPGFHETYQTRVWDLVQAWAKERATDADKATVREKIRVSILSRRGARRAGKNASDVAAAARSARLALEPADVINRNEWLFRQAWVDWSMDDLKGENFDDYKKRDAHIAALRAEALREVIAERGPQGIIALAEAGTTAFVIGRILARELIPEDAVPALVLAFTPHELAEPSWARKQLVAGVLGGLDVGPRERTLDTLESGLPDTDRVRMLLLAPFERTTWRRVATLDDATRRLYWEGVSPDWSLDPEAQNEAVEELLRAERPRAAFACARFNLETVRPELLFRVMSGMLASDKDPPGYFRANAHEIENAFGLLDKHAIFSLEQMALLELSYIEVLSQPWREREGYGLPNLEKYVEAHPELFIQAVVWTYRRKDGGIDPPEWRVPPEMVLHCAERGHKLIEGLERIPGHNDVGELDAKNLMAWIKTVRDACSALGRLDVADLSIGKLLAESPAGDDGVWPCEPVRRVMEDLRSKNIMRGAHTGLYNSRGAHWRGEGGDQERGLAATYRAWANALQYTHPFLASELLMGMALTYEHEARREDTEAKVRRRLRS